MSSQYDAVAFIFARGGSKGLPGKNIRMFAGKPLIAWAIEHAHKAEGIGRVIVSTDSEEIAAVASQYGAEVPFMRPSHLAKDDSPEWLSWRHALEFIRNDEGSLPDAMVSVPVTAPLRQPVDVERCLELFSEGDADEPFNDRGRCMAGAQISDAVMPGVAFLWTGARFDPDFAHLPTGIVMATSPC